MANIPRLIDWLISQRGLLDLEIEQVQSTARLIPGWHDYSTSLSLMGRRFVGRAVDSVEESAIYRSACEAVERLMVHEFDLYPGSGVAIHTDMTAAARNAELELIERDRILCHHLTGVPFTLVSDDELLPRVDRQKVARVLSDLGLRLRFFSTQRERPFEVAICVIDDALGFPLSLGRAIFGFGSAASLDKACEKALLECIQNVPILSGELEAGVTKLCEFSALKVVRPRDHGFLALDQAYSSAISHLFSDVLSKRSSNRESRPLNVAFRTFHSRILPEELGFALVQAQSAEVQHFFLGESVTNLVNMNRLRSFVGESITSIAQHPHFIG